MENSLNKSRIINWVIYKDSALNKKFSMLLNFIFRVSWNLEETERFFKIL